jgi:hypothetical protein
MVRIGIGCDRSEDRLVSVPAKLVRGGKLPIFLARPTDRSSILDDVSVDVVRADP